MPTRPHVALLIESSRAYGRGLLMGIAQYARLHGNWAIFHQERAIDDPAPQWLARWPGDGIIARIVDPSLVRTLRRRKLPTVDVRGLHELPGIPLVETDDRAVMAQAIEHLRERGFERFAYCGFPGANYSQRRLAYCRQMLTALALPLEVYEAAPLPRRRPKVAAATTVAIETQDILFEDAIGHWLSHLPKPIGVIACNDIRGQQVLNAARARGIAVPEDVAVIGVDNDEVLCELADPPLTSVEPDTERIGYEAASLLDRMMRGKRPPAATIFVKPRGVIPRQSTDVLAMADRQVAAAVRFIRQHAADGIDVEAVLAHAPLSRSTLERRFEEYLGRSPKAEIMRVRLDRTKRLLEETDYTLAAIAAMTGFKHAEYLSAVFKRRTGLTPGEYRSQRAQVK